MQLLVVLVMAAVAPAALSGGPAAVKNLIMRRLSHSYADLFDTVRNKAALHDDFSEQNRSWDESGTICSDT